MSESEPGLRIDRTRDEHELCACGMGHDRWDGGHSLSFMQTRLAGATSTKWRDAIVDAVSASGTISVTTLDDGQTVALWHHSNPGELLEVGEPVALHSVYHVLAIGGAWISVAEFTN
jgi:hypothetical protein